MPKCVRKGSKPMARDPKAATLALHRFGLGPREGAIEAITPDPLGALLAELERPAAGLLTADLRSSGAANSAVFEYNAERTAKDKLASRRREEAQKLAENTAPQNPADNNTMAAQPEPP